tara:strand:- start:425 stop:820 length:396 start_codon:yes stop_codon:yes gene_type:complete
MQIDAHEIYTANYHRWAEPLDEGIAKLLVQVLNKKSDYYQFGRKLEPWKQNVDFYLRLEFEKFHATNSAQVVATGRYWFYTRDSLLKIDKPFNISINLTRNGYLHTVEKLKLAINKLSVEIMDSLNYLERR